MENNTLLNVYIFKNQFHLYRRISSLRKKDSLFCTSHNRIAIAILFAKISSHLFSSEIDGCHRGIRYFSFDGNQLYDLT